MLSPPLSEADVALTCRSCPIHSVRMGLFFNERKRPIPRDTWDDVEKDFKKVPALLTSDSKGRQCTPLSGSPVRLTLVGVGREGTFFSRYVMT